MRTAGGVKPADFLNQGAKQYLATCEREIFDSWRSRNKPTLKDVSLAYTLTSTLIKRFKAKTIGLQSTDPHEYGVYSLFQHTNDTAGKFVEMYLQARKTTFPDFLILTQSPEFKSKFNYDDSTMTRQSITDDFQDFVDFFKPPIELRLHIVELQDFAFDAAIFRRGDKEYLNISYDQHP